MHSIKLADYYSYSGDMFLLILCILFYLILKTNYVKRDKRGVLISASLIVLAVAALSHILLNVLCVDGNYSVLAYILADVYNFILMGMFVVYYDYLSMLISSKGRMLKVAGWINAGIVVTGYLTIIAGQIWHNGIGQSGSTVIWNEIGVLSVFLTVYVLEMALIGSLILVYRKRIIRKVVNMFLCTEFICIFIVASQLIIDSDSLIAMTFSLPLFVVLMELHSTPYNLVNGSRDFGVLEQYIAECYTKKKENTYLCLKLYLNDNTEFPQELGKLFYNFYEEVFPKAQLFSNDVANYVLVIPKAKSKDVAKNIENLIAVKFAESYAKFRLRYKIIVFDEIDFDNFKNFEKCISFWLSKMSMNSYAWISTCEMEEYTHEMDIIKQLRNINDTLDLFDDRILTYCQPIKNLETGEYDTAEALMRLELPGMGMVFPDVFIPLAESNGCIHGMSLIILNKTCHEVKRLREEGYKIDRVSVNFALEDILENNFIDEFKSIVEENGISYDSIGVEITESQSEQDYDRLYSQIQELKSLGAVIYLDDFGTGYSNLDRILKLEFDLIKMDRSLLLMADSEEDNNRLLKMFSESFGNMGYKILCEGVETEEQEKKCRAYNMNYLQGYKYSKPIPIEKLRDFLKKTV